MFKVSLEAPKLNGYILFHTTQVYMVSVSVVFRKEIENKWEIL